MWITILKNGLAIAAGIMLFKIANAATGNKISSLAA
jgi:hypothetical protein